MLVQMQMQMQMLVLVLMQKSLTRRCAVPPFAKGGLGGFALHMQPYNPRLKPFSRQLPSAMTDAEQRLWQRLRRKQIAGVQFYRQKPLLGCIVDFFAPAAGLVVELDGGQHLEPAAREAVARRDAALARLGLKVLRFDDRAALLQTDAVVAVVWREVCAAIGREE